MRIEKKMTVKDLKAAINNLPDDLEVIWKKGEQPVPCSHS